MRHLNKLTLLLLFVATILLATSCASSKKSQCGCAGMVGYGNK